MRGDGEEEKKIKTPWRPKNRRRRAKLTRKVVVLFTPTHYDQLRSRAALLGYSVSAFVRAVTIMREPPPAELAVPPAPGPGGPIPAGE